MSHYAHIVPTADAGIFLVDNVIVIDADTLATGHWGDPSEWVQTSYNTHGGVHSGGGTPFRKNYAGKGMLYDPAADGGSGAFYNQQPFPSWTLNTDRYEWEAPTPQPVDGPPTKWDEATLSWVEAFPSV